MITQETLNELQYLIQKEASFLRIATKESNATGRSFTYYNIKLQETKYLDTEHHPLNVTKELKGDIEDFLEGKGFQKILWNNNYTTFWIG